MPLEALQLLEGQELALVSAEVLLAGSDSLIIEAMVKLAKGLGTQVVEMFVGNLETRQELLAMWVTLGQGAFLGPSRAVHDIPALQP